MKPAIHPIFSGTTVVAVTKTFPFSAVDEAYKRGFRHIGENRVEEAKRKIEQARKNGLNDIVWHMIGHIQSRKVREVVELFDWVDSVDSINVAQKLDTSAASKKKQLRILLEVNISGEEAKYGFDLAGWEQNSKKLHRFYGLIEEIMKLKYVRVEGLMTMAPYVIDAQDNRPIFRSMKHLSSSIRAQNPMFGTHLSMGTSCDYEVALQEGATEVRLGEVLFGPRE